MKVSGSNPLPATNFILEDDFMYGISKLEKVTTTPSTKWEGEPIYVTNSGSPYVRNESASSGASEMIYSKGRCEGSTVSEDRPSPDYIRIYDSVRRMERKIDELDAVIDEICLGKLQASPMNSNTPLNQKNPDIPPTVISVLAETPGRIDDVGMRIETIQLRLRDMFLE